MMKWYGTIIQKIALRGKGGGPDKAPGGGEFPPILSAGGILFS